MGGSLEWQVPNALADAGGLTQTLPHPTTDRELARMRATLAAGHTVRLRAIVGLAGGTSVFKVTLGAWVRVPAAAQLELQLTLRNASGDALAWSHELALPPSDVAIEPDVQGAAWQRLRAVQTPPLLPPFASAGQAAAFADADLEAVFVARGGVRLIHATLFEAPAQHAVAHDAPSLLHDAGPGQLPINGPRESAPDGSWVEQRWGTSRMLDVARRQLGRLGPVVLTWASWADGMVPVGAEIPTPVVVSSGWTSLVDAGETRWNPDAPGWPITAAHCLGAAGANVARTGVIAVLPVRVWAWARHVAPTNPGQLRVQTTARSSVVMPISGAATWAWHTTTGFLEASRSPRDVRPTAQLFARSGGADLEVAAVVVEAGHRRPSVG